MIIIIATIILFAVAGAITGGTIVAQKAIRDLTMYGIVDSTVINFMCRVDRLVNGDWEYSLVLAVMTAISIVYGQTALGLSFLALQGAVLYLLGSAAGVAEQMEIRMARRRSVSRG